MSPVVVLSIICREDNMSERWKRERKEAVRQRAALCLDCEYQNGLKTIVPTMGLLRVKPENVAVRVDCKSAGEGVKPCTTEGQRERRIAHRQRRLVG